ncbi:hypothetical protein CcrC1_gp410 [Caulobacter phage C1]|nr:hypothetical protein CcrC1_gp410 [Caulobacter phage C1]UTU08639.1 hypothetical protein CcrC2_gp411 [Caulobacter phage C2]UTU09153.1 hypothetical protein CcrJ4_gp405 [Caulobacter phage J4]UTU10271.1 hypothetical protein CcrRB23_gp409 [Caulobacter phage RB23]WGN97305.1 hypothetical protein [Bertelyvirus sp.]
MKQGPQERDYHEAIVELSDVSIVEGLETLLERLRAKGQFEVAAWVNAAAWRMRCLRTTDPTPEDDDDQPDLAALEHIKGRGGLLDDSEPLPILDSYVHTRRKTMPDTLRPWYIVMVYTTDGRVIGPIEAKDVDWADNVGGYRLGWARKAIQFDAADQAHIAAAAIGRVEVDVDYYLDQMIDAPLWLWKAHALDYGMDPWQFFMDLPVEPEDVKERGLRIFVQIKNMPHKDK